MLDETRTIAGIETRVVEERETVDGALAEVSRNFFAIEKGTNSVMTSNVPDSMLVDRPIDRGVLRTLVERHFQDMVKFVVDVERGIAAVGGELHADEEALLLEHGSRQEHLWGANYYPGRGAEACIEYTSLINIRPSQGNRSMVIEDETLRARIREITYQLIGRGEALP